MRVCVWDYKYKVKGSEEKIKREVGRSRPTGLYQALKRASINTMFNRQFYYWWGVCVVYVWVGVCREVFRCGR